MKLVVDTASRQAKMRAHTATHLLHFSLDAILGGTKQAGSLVDNDFIRFDFAAKNQLTSTQITQIENQINEWIFSSQQVVVEEMSLEDAKKTGAKAFFEDKYGDTVRVVQVRGESEAPLISIELCGGTHVSDTAHIGAFKIVSQEAVASGIRRISAVTGPGVSRICCELESQRNTLASKVDSQPKQLPEKIDKLIAELSHLKADHESLQTQIVCSHLKELGTPSSNFHQFDYVLNISGTTLEHHNFKIVVNQAKSYRSDFNRLLYNNEGNFCIYIGKGDISAKDFAHQHELKGGGSDHLVQGRTPNIVSILG